MPSLEYKNEQHIDSVEQRLESELSFLPVVQIAVAKEQNKRSIPSKKGNFKLSTIAMHTLASIQVQYSTRLRTPLAA